MNMCIVRCDVTKVAVLDNKRNYIILSKLKK